ncbi:Nucleotide-binding universal stress protein, UspA family [Agreia bicolorata]|uniref:Nucleotide-binding universal stress protein, UspA family n=1 Tax=Agreia bicolorata TaxID=110935 RepID=A0A1T4YD83_9MICO|nr:universal stress protein [Agreia bicolorata]SKA99643.1 Nucleotide-binding universal stress protein, UspA family [Agreia bicolorata]
MTSRTIVACGHGKSAEAALAWAIHRSRWIKDPMMLVHVVEKTTLVPGKVLPPERFDRAQDLLDAAAGKVREAVSGIDVRTQVITGDVVPSLVSHTDPDTLLVIGETGLAARAHSSWSIGVRVPARAAGPVAVIPSGVTPDRRGVVVGVDDTDECIRLAQTAAAEALATGQALHVIHAWRAPSMWLDSFPLDDEFIEDIAQAHRHLVDDILAALRREHPSLDITGQAVHGNAAQSLLQCDPLPALVVVGTRSKSPFERLLLGSVSRDVLLNLDAPAIIVPPVPAIHASPDNQDRASGSTRISL